MVSVVALLLHFIENGPDPEVMVTEAMPLQVLLQVALTTEVLSNGPPMLLSNTTEEEVQDFESVTVTV